MRRKFTWLRFLLLSGALALPAVAQDLTVTGQVKAPAPGRLELTAADGKIYRLQGDMIQALQAMGDLATYQIEVSGARSGPESDPILEVKSYRVSAGRKAEQTAVSPLPARPGPITVTGTVQAQIIAKNEIRTDDGRILKIESEQPLLVEDRSSLPQQATIEVTGEEQGPPDNASIKVTSFKVIRAPEVAVPQGRALTMDGKVERAPDGRWTLVATGGKEFTLVGQHVAQLENLSDKDRRRVQITGPAQIYVQGHTLLDEKTQQALATGSRKVLGGVTRVKGNPRFKGADGKLYRLTADSQEIIEQITRVKKYGIEIEGEVVGTTAEPELRVVSYRVLDRPVERVWVEGDTTIVTDEPMPFKGAVVRRGAITELRTVDGRVYRLTGDQVTLLGDGLFGDRAVQVYGSVDGDTLRVRSYRVLPETISALGISTAGPVAVGAPLTLEGVFVSKLLGRDQFRTSDGRVFKLTGDQAKALEDAASNNQPVTITGTLEGSGDDKVFKVQSFQVKAAGEAAPARQSSQPLTVEGKVVTHWLGAPEIQTTDGRTFTLSGSQLKALEAEGKIKDNNVKLTGTLEGSGTDQKLNVQSYSIAEPAAQTAASQPAQPSAAPAPAATEAAASPAPAAADAPAAQPTTEAAAQPTTVEAAPAPAPAQTASDAATSEGVMKPADSAASAPELEKTTAGKEPEATAGRQEEDSKEERQARKRKERKVTRSKEEARRDAGIVGETGMSPVAEPAHESKREPAEAEAAPADQQAEESMAERKERNQQRKSRSKKQGQQKEEPAEQAPDVREETPEEQEEEEEPATVTAP